MESDDDGDGDGDVCAGLLIGGMVVVLPSFVPLVVEQEMAGVGNVGAKEVTAGIVLHNHESTSRNAVCFTGSVIMDLLF